MRWHGTRQRVGVEAMEGKLHLCVGAPWQCQGNRTVHVVRLEAVDRRRNVGFTALARDVSAMPACGCVDAMCQHVGV